MITDEIFTEVLKGISNPCESRENLPGQKVCAKHIEWIH